MVCLLVFLYMYLGDVHVLDWVQEWYPIRKPFMHLCNWLLHRVLVVWGPQVFGQVYPYWTQLGQLRESQWNNLYRVEQYRIIFVIELESVFSWWYFRCMHWVRHHSSLATLCDYSYHITGKFRGTNFSWFPSSYLIRWSYFCGCCRLKPHLPC